MSIKNKVVIHNPTTKKHEPLASGDVLAGSIIQVSTDAGNSLRLGTDGGLKVVSASKQVLFGEVIGNNNRDVTVTFSSAFPTIPFITLTPVTDGNKYSDFCAYKITTTGFVLRRGYLQSSYLIDIAWKAEEK